MTHEPKAPVAAESEHTSRTTPRNRFVDYTKGALIALVTIGHTIQYVVYKNVGYLEDPLFKAIYLFHMPLFMAISGYLSFSGLQRSRFGPFAAAKLKAYFVPIAVWAIFTSLAGFFLEKQSLSSLPRSLVANLAHSMWFLWALLGSLIFTAAVKAIGKHFWKIYFLSGIALILLPEKLVLPLYLLKYMYPYFQLGYTAATLGTPFLKRANSLAIFVGAAIVTLVLYCLWTPETYIYFSKMALVSGNYGHIIVRYLAGVSASIVALLALNFLWGRSASRLGRTVETWGRDSIFIYIVQSYLFPEVQLLMGRLPYSFGSGALGSLTGVLAGVLITWACWAIGDLLARNDTLAFFLFGRSVISVRK